MTRVLIDQFDQPNIIDLPRFTGDNNGQIIMDGSNYLWCWDGKNVTTLELPDWLADGIRELVKNKIEQENNKGA